jgi:hypothetical protein
MVKALGDTECKPDLICHIDSFLNNRARDGRKINVDLLMSFIIMRVPSQTCSLTYSMSQSARSRCF